jgi:hypothetical protein
MQTTCPLYRQSVMLERETGIELSRATLDSWVMRVGELLRPITRAMPLELLAGNYIQADETPLGVQSERVRGKNYEADEITTTTSDLENSDLSLLLGRVIHWKRP